MRSVLSIAGSDSGGGAGVQQDLKVFSSFRLHGASVITAATAQNTLGVQEIHTLPVEFVESQLDSVLSDLDVGAAKTGMLSSREVIDLVRKKVREYGLENLVVDPVMVSTSGDRLLSRDATASMKKLAAESFVSTPNIAEAEVLTGMHIESVEDMEAAAEKLGCCVVKGGHLSGVDVLYFEGDIYRFEPRALVNASLHGTGCAFSAAIASGLALGYCLPEAVGKAKEFMDSAISRYYSPGKGLFVIDTASIRPSVTYEDAERREVADALSCAIELFCSHPCSFGLVPEVGLNIGFALPGAKAPGDVAGISGRIVKDKYSHLPVPVGFVMFDGTSHVGRIIHSAMSFDPEVRSAMNLRYSPEAVEVCCKLGFSVSSFDREKQPADTSTMEWGTHDAIKRGARVPDMIFDLGAKGKEPMIRVLGKTPGEVVEKALKVGGGLR